MPKINLKPLSVNEAFSGRHFNTPKKKKFEKEFSSLTKNWVLEDSVAPYQLNITVGVNKRQDLDNCLKCTIDCLMTHFGINDRDIWKIVAVKVPVKKGEEFIEVDILSYNFQNNGIK